MDIDEITVDTDEGTDGDETNYGYNPGMTPTTSRVRITGAAQDSDAETSGTERENTSSFRSPLPPWRHGRRTREPVR